MMVKILERLLVIIAVAVILIILTIPIALVVNGVFEIGYSIFHYYSVRRSHHIFCLNLAKDNPNIYWKDETFMGIGEDDSYGCYMKQGE